jgi:Leucine-rich repeat (LRR) protein
MKRDLELYQQCNQMDLITLLRENKCKVEYDEEFNPNWSDEELLSHVIKLDCSENQLTTLPDLPNCQILTCHNNQLTILPDLPNCEELFCGFNQLTALPDLPKCIRLYCDRNRLHRLPDLPCCKILRCAKNQLTSLPKLPNCEGLNCSNNNLTYLPVCYQLYRFKDRPKPVPGLVCYKRLCCDNNRLPFDDLDEWVTIWKTRRLYLKIKYFRLWYWKMLESKAHKKQKLHLELLWSPETKFYQATEEYRHFVQSSQRSKN